LHGIATDKWEIWLGVTLKQGKTRSMGLRDPNDANMPVVEASRRFYLMVLKHLCVNEDTSTTDDRIWIQSL
jgi:hypothetical protein